MTSIHVYSNKGEEIVNTKDTNAETMLYYVLSLKEEPVELMDTYSRPVEVEQVIRLAIQDVSCVYSQQPDKYCRINRGGYQYTTVYSVEHQSLNIITYNNNIIIDHKQLSFQVVTKESKQYQKDRKHRKHNQDNQLAALINKHHQQLDTSRQQAERLQKENTLQQKTNKQNILAKVRHVVQQTRAIKKQEQEQEMISNTGNDDDQ